MSAHNTNTEAQASTELCQPGPAPSATGSLPEHITDTQLLRRLRHRLHQDLPRPRRWQARRIRHRPLAAQVPRRLESHPDSRPTAQPSNPSSTTFPPPSACAQPSSDAMRETGNDRLIIVEGNPGDGKSSAVAALVGRYGSRIVLAEAAETWRDSINAMLADLLLAMRRSAAPIQLRRPPG
jgi:hypothetical protein